MASDVTNVQRNQVLSALRKLGGQGRTSEIMREAGLEYHLAQLTLNDMTKRGSLTRVRNVPATWKVGDR